MNDIRDLFPGRMRERAFQLKARRDTGVAWHEPQFVECKQCGRRATRQIWAKSLFVCPNCGNHQPIGAYYRLSLVLDSGSFRELDAELAPQDVLGFPGYPEKLSAQTQKTGLSEAAVAAVGRIGGVSVVAAVLDSRFFMGSMSTAVGEKITRAIEYAAAKNMPLPKSFRWSSSRPAAAPGCRRASSALCRWPRPAPPSSAFRPRAGCTSVC